MLATIPNDRSRWLPKIKDVEQPGNRSSGSKVDGQVSQRPHKQPVITKIQVAEQQLDTSIRLFFENIDYLSSYALAAASREITDDLCEKKKHELFQEETARLGDPLKVHLSFREEMGIVIKPEFLNDAVKLFRKRQNFLKHAEKDPTEQWTSCRPMNWLL